MAQNITLLGASYTAVPAVLLPKTGGGTAQFDDTTDANATAADIAQSKTAYVNGAKITGTGSGGSSTYTLTNIVPTQTIATTTSNLYGYVGLISTYTAYVQSGEWYLVTYDNDEYVVTGYYGANNEILIGDYQLITSNVEWLETPFMVEHNLTNGYFFLGSRVSGNHTLKVDKITFLDDGVTLINKSITANGTYNASSDNADGYSSVTVNVSGGGGLDYETGIWIPTGNTSRGDIYFARTHTEAPSCFFVYDSTTTQETTNAENLVVTYVNFHQFYGTQVTYGSSSHIYGLVGTRYRTSQTGTSGASIAISTPYTDTSDTKTFQSRYWAKEDHISVTSNSSSRYWRANREYVWIAVWKP